MEAPSANAEERTEGGGGVKARGGRGCRLARKLILFPHVNSVCRGERGLVWFVDIY